MIVRTGAASRAAGDSVRLRKRSATPFASLRQPSSRKLFAAQNFGSVWGLKLAVMSVIYADYYGREHLGKIAAVDAMSGLAGTAVALDRALLEAPLCPPPGEEGARVSVAGRQ